MNKAICSLNFMYCMERFATQIYHVQAGAFKDNENTDKLKAASVNEKRHVISLRTSIRELKGTLIPLGFLFQFAGTVLGVITRISGKNCMFKADIFVEKKAVQDYASFVKNVKFDERTVELLHRIISDEERHVVTWDNSLADLTR